MFSVLHRQLPVILLFFILSGKAYSQEPSVAERYEKATAMLPEMINPLLTNTIGSSSWLPDGRLLYALTDKNGTAFYVANPKKKSFTKLSDAQIIAEALSNASRRKIDPTDFRISGLGLSNNDKILSFSYRGSLYNFDLAANKLSAVEKTKTPASSFISPDGSKAAFIRDHNLWLFDLNTKKETQLTFDGVEDYGYATNNAGWTQSDGPVLLWSPDSKHIASFRQDARGVGKMFLASSKVGHPDLEAWAYPMPGDSVVFRVERIIINLDPSPSMVKLKMAPDIQRSTITDHIAGRGGILLDAEWSADSKQLAFVSTSRNHQSETLRIADPQTGEVRDVMNETVSTFYESGVDAINWRFLPESNEFIWYSERSNWGHLYLYDLKTGEVKKQITSGDWIVKELKKVDTKKRTLYFTAAGREKGDPYFDYLYRINMDGTGLTLLTPDSADHSVSVSDDGNFLIDTWSSPQQPPVTAIRNNQGKIVTTLATGDITALKASGWQPPIPFTVKARDGKTDLYGLMYTPTWMDSSKTYPVLNYIYPGPQTGSVGGRSFSPTHRDKQSLAELGFIVVELDAMGTPGRSHEFHAYYYGNMGDNGLPDQISGIRQLADRYGFLDTSKVGIWGHSGGGFASTRGILEYPDFYKVAVSAAGNHDNRTYEDDWGEKWQGLLTTDGKGTNYDNQANQNLAHNLKGKLLLAHGTMDNNVPPNNTMVLVDSLIAAGKDFDLLLLPNRRHGFYMEPYMIRKRWNYFVKNLRGEEPPADFNLQAPKRGF